MYGENREYPQAAHLLTPIGVVVVGMVLAIVHSPVWWLLVTAFAGRAAYLGWLLAQRRRSATPQPGTVAP